MLSARVGDVIFPFPVTFIARIARIASNLNLARRVARPYRVKIPRSRREEMTNGRAGQSEETLAAAIRANSNSRVNMRAVV